MNLGDKTRSLTVRLTVDQYEFLERSASAIEVTPSKFLRMVVNSCMVASVATDKAMKEAEKSLEHSKADLDNLVQQ